MVDITRKLFDRIVKRLPSARIAVIGDLMLDQYLWGSVSRISPEAPVPVVEIESESVRLGGAGNVVHNLVSLGVQAVPVGVIGDDSAGEKILNEFRTMGLPVEGILVETGRTTPVKTRVIAHGQHVVRTDREKRGGISKDSTQKVLGFLRETLPNLDAICFEDYDKGLISRKLIRGVMDMQPDIPVTVDPKFDNFFEYKGVTVFKPNVKETEAKVGARLSDDDVVAETALGLRGRLGCANVLITLGERGMCLADDRAEVSWVPTRARKVHDVSGAGDTVISTLTACMCAGASVKEAASIANHAAGVVCGEVGIVPIDLEKLRRDLFHEEN